MADATASDGVPGGHAEPPSSEERLSRLLSGVVQNWRVVDRRIGSVVLRGHSTDLGEVSIKYFPGPGGLGRAQAEHDLLARYAVDESGPRGPLVPRAYGVIDDGAGGGALMSEWISGVRFDRFLGTITLTAGKRRAALERVGRWLGAFHARGGPEKQPLAHAIDVAGLLEALQAHVGKGRPAVTACEERLAELADRSVIVTRLHNDFVPQNIFLRGDSVVGFDLAQSERGPALRDAARLMANTVWMAHSSLNPRLGATIADDAATLLRGYGDGLGLAGKPDPAVARLFLLDGLCRKAKGIAKKLDDPQIGKRLPASMHARMIRRVLNHLLSDPVH